MMAAVEAWLWRFRNRKIVVYCDNQNVCRAINKNTTSCMKCMKLVRMVIFKCLTLNVSIFAQYIKSKDNKFADLLSRDQIHQFKIEAKRKNWNIDSHKTPVPNKLWPMSKIW